tara:strand:- start:5474 stop:6514 length:1041 start_codon:yes stop_codon:yes gene_type:complete
MSKKIAIITEFFDPPFDEGIKKTAFNLFYQLNKIYDVFVFCRKGDLNEKINPIISNRLFLGNRLRMSIKKKNPDVILYLPFSSSTFASYLRLLILKIFFRHKKVIFFCLQPKPIKSRMKKYIIKLIKPDFAFTPSLDLKRIWDKNKVNNKLIPLYTNKNNFSIVDSKTKQRLRDRYDIPRDKFIVSHIGHLNYERNLKTLISIQKKGFQVVLVVSTSTPADAISNKGLIEDLKSSGIIIIQDFIKDIKEIYQLSDLYLFPVVLKNSSIGLPLSVLEARACGTTVLTTDFGSLKHFLGNDNGGIFYSEPKDFVKKVKNIKDKSVAFNKTNIGHLNDMFLDIISAEII